MINLRIATTLDGEVLSEIYRYYVTDTTVTFEYVPPSVEAFSSKIVHRLKKYPYIVAEENGKPVGYAFASQFRERAAYGWDAELSIYVSSDKHRTGVGKRLYSALIELLRIQNFANLYAWIIDPNPVSVAFHESMGFEKICNIKAAGYKHGEWHDVGLYQIRISDMSEPKPIIPFPELDKNLVENILN
ncbi:MAG: N-acetyltransferase [Clostridia bacterium]|nr:N-acetyltransferase [Clostridia bacterium]